MSGMTGFTEMKTGWGRDSDDPMADDFSAMLSSVTLSNAKGLLFGSAWAGAWCRRFFALLRMTTWGWSDNMELEGRYGVGHNVGCRTTAGIVLL